MTVTACEIVQRLRARYATERGWLTFAELQRQGEATGPGARRTTRQIDFVAVNRWESRRGQVVAVEVKVDRADFAREVETPEKRAAWEDVASEFWFATPAGLVQPDEVPEGCGLLEVWGQKLRARKRAQARKTAGADPPLLRAIVRRLAGDVEQAEREREAFAEFRGRSLSFDDLELMARRIAERRHESAVTREARRIAEEQRADAKRRHEDYWGPRKEIIRELERLCREVDPSLRWDADPPEVLRVLRALRAIVHPSVFVQAMRQAADAVEEVFRSGRVAGAMRGHFHAGQDLAKATESVGGPTTRDAGSYLPPAEGAA